MNSRVLLEAFGYLGSTLVVVSMLMSSVIRLRIINMTGSVISAIYALIIRSYPLALMNICLVIINLYHLTRLRNTDKHYDLVEGPASEGYLSYLLRYYREDIAKYFPDFSAQEQAGGSSVFTVCCDQEVAGVMIGKKSGSKMEVSLDYSTPVYRDCSVGTYLYSRLPEFGVTELSCRCRSKEHEGYLLKMGFERSGDGLFRKKLK